MSEHTQTILAGRTDGVHGNCMQAAIASLLDLPLDAVPHFAQFTWWPQAIEFWARGRQLTVKVVDIDSMPTRRCIVAGRSPRGIEHVVVVDGGEVVWDPHPSRDGLSSIAEAWFFEPWPDDLRTCWQCGQERPS